jgi:hypothetical protein
MQQHAIKSCRSSRSATRRPNLHRGIAPLIESCQCRDHRCPTFHRPSIHSSQCCCVFPTGHYSRCPPPYSVGALRPRTSSLDPATYRVTVRRLPPSHMTPGSDQSNENDETKTNLHSTAPQSSIPSVPCRSMLSETRDIQSSSNRLLIATTALHGRPADILARSLQSSRPNDTISRKHSVENYAIGGLSTGMMQVETNPYIGPLQPSTLMNRKSAGPINYEGEPTAETPNGPECASILFDHF